MPNAGSGAGLPKGRLGRRLAYARIEDYSLVSNPPDSSSRPKVSLGPLSGHRSHRPGNVTVRRQGLLAAVPLVTEQPRLCDNDAPAPSPRYPVLLLREGIDVGAVFPLERCSVLIGRDPKVSLVIRAPGISRVHARIYRRLESWYVEDLGSAHGTMVGELPVNWAPIEDGDVIQLGPAVSLLFTMVSREQELALRRLYEAGRTDPATGTLKEQYYEHELVVATESAAENDQELSVLYLKLDGYEVLLERWGREATDAVLGHVAGTVRQRLGTETVVARVGEAEFAALLPGATLAEASRTAERVRIAVATARSFIQGALVSLSISVGVGSLKGAETPTSTDLMEAARGHLQLASLDGGNRVVF
jgi:diguanylate cyclase (GGDEF)-like protein